MSAGADTKLNTYRGGPDERGHFGLYGGRFVAETLMPLILDLEREYNEAKADPKFQAEMDHHLATYVGRPSLSGSRSTAAAPRSISSARSSTTPAHIR